ncbi:peptidylprolyl isomerase [Sulfurospirillum sp. 1612]|uniref:peptidylprolyl isomerase n=1 Tax=Sulfurospirillum sp. 1612 TaxID=3094835 RepID=UPI002F94051A
MSLKQYDFSQEELAKCQWAVITTKNGDMNIKLYANEAPNTVANFATLARDGFYNGLNFHRVIPGFVAQGGCPNKTGTGGPGWNIACECDQNTSKHEKGKLSMAHAGPNTGGSQFFICYDNLPHLDGLHTIFGGIEADDDASMKVLDSIKQGDDILKVEIKDAL